MRKNSVFLNDQNKRLTRLNKNYFFAATLLIVFVNFFLFFFPVVYPSLTDARPEWNTFSLANLFQALLSAYTHSGSQHCALNMLCFLIAGAYLERKQGSLRFLSFVIVLSFFAEFATSTNYISLKHVGFSSVNYALYGYIIIDYIFVLFHKEKRDVFNVAAGAVILGLIYFAMCFSGGTSQISFAWYPYDLLHNIGHASGFFVGILFGLYESISDLVRQSAQQTEQKLGQKAAESATNATDTSGATGASDASDADDKK